MRGCSAEAAGARRRCSALASYLSRQLKAMMQENARAESCDPPNDPLRRGDRDMSPGRRDALQSLTAIAAAAAAWAFPGAAAMAQAAYPAKPVRILVGFPPGGPADLSARVLAEQLSKAFGQTFLVDNRAGASGMMPTPAARPALP